MSKKDDAQQDDSVLIDDDLQTDSPSTDDKQSLPSDDGQDLDDLRQELDDVKKLASQMEDQLKRAVADYQNLEKRVSEGRQELAQWATSDLIKRLLPVLHSFNMVVEKGRPVLSEKAESKDWFKGVELSLKQLQEILRSEGLDEIKIDPGSSSSGTGSQFDPSLHEAVDTIEGEHDKIMSVVQKGYTLNGKVLEPAKVVVGRKSD